MTIIRDGLQSADFDMPIAAPSLSLDFVNSETLDRRISFTRASSGTRTNKNGLVELVPANQPRFDYDPVSGNCKGLLVEGQRTNLITYSNTFTNSAWTSTSNVTITDNVSISPDGSQNAALIESKSGLYGILLRQYYTYTLGTAYTFSCFVKKGNWRYIGIRLEFSILYGPNAAYYPTFDLDTKTFSTNGVSGVTFSYQEYPNGWFRLFLTYTATVGGYQVTDIGLVDSNGNSQTSVGPGARTAYVYGAQLEAHNYGTSYIPTTSSTATRSPDNVSMTGSNFASWFGDPNEYTVFLSCIAPYGPITTVQLDYWTMANSSNFYGELIFSEYAGLPQLIMYVNNGGSFNIFANPTSGELSDLKFACFFEQRKVSMLLNDSRTDYPYAFNTQIPRLPTGLDSLYLGSRNGSDFHMNGTIRKFVVYPKRISNQQAYYLVT